MALNVIHSSNNTLTTTNLGLGNWFTVQLYLNQYYRNNEVYWRPGTKKIFGFSAVNTENISLAFSTEWEESGGAKLGSAIFGKMNNMKIFKAFAAQSLGGYQPMIVTDAWTQQKLKGTSPIKVSLKFKLYKDQQDIAGSNNYKDVIEFLTHICSPVRPISAGEDAVNYVKNVAIGAYDVGGKLIQQAQNSLGVQPTQTEDGMVTKVARQVAGNIAGVINTLNGIYEDSVATGWTGANNGNFTVIFTLGNKVFSHKTDQTDLKSIKGATGEKLVDWIVQSFSFQPSTQFYWDEKLKLPLPLWCDFTLELETRMSLSNESVYNLLNKNKIHVEIKE